MHILKCTREECFSFYTVTIQMTAKENLQVFLKSIQKLMMTTVALA